VNRAEAVKCGQERSVNQETSMNTNDANPVRTRPQPTTADESEAEKETPRDALPTDKQDPEKNNSPRGSEGSIPESE